MGLFDAVGAADVLSAIEEFGRLGAQEFLNRYGFSSDHDYVLWHDGRTYDAAAILGVARQFAGSTPATPDQFSDFSAAKLLMELGFYVTSTDPYGGVGKTPIVRINTPEIIDGRTKPLVQFIMPRNPAVLDQVNSIDHMATGPR